MKATLINIPSLEFVDNGIGKCYNKGKYYPNEDRGNKRIDRICNKMKHSSMLRFVHYVFNVEVSTSVLLEASRHQVGIDNAFKCISGDSRITTSNGFKTIEELYQRQNDLKRLPKVRTYNEATKEFEFVSISEIYSTGTKQAYTITTDNGKEITTSIDHKFYSDGRWIKVKDLSVGDSIATNGVATIYNREWLHKQKYTYLNTGKGLVDIAKDTGYSERLLRKQLREFELQYTDLEKSIIGTSSAKTGGYRLYKNKEWLENTKIGFLNQGKGLSNIAEEFYINYNTLRKWLKIHNLQYTDKEKALVVHNNHNKYMPEYKDVLVGRTREKKEQTARESASGISQNVRRFLLTDGITCSKCGGTEMLEVDHIQPVKSHPELATSLANMQVLCHRCHAVKTTEERGLRAKETKPRKGMSKRVFTIKHSKITSIVKNDVIEMFDMEVNHISHNYVANGIVVHNSTRYTIRDLNIEYEMSNDKRVNELLMSQRAEAIELIVKNPDLKPDDIKLLLPQAFVYKGQMQFNAQSLQHFIKLRTDKASHFHIREFANELYSSLPDDHKFLFEDSVYKEKS